MGEQPRPVWDDVQEQIRLAWITKETPPGAYVLEMHEDDLFETARECVIATLFCGICRECGTEMPCFCRRDD